MQQEFASLHSMNFRNLVLGITMTSALISQSTAAPVNIYFVNESGMSNNQVFIAWQNGTGVQGSFSSSYGSGTNYTDFSFGAATNNYVITTNVVSLDTLGASGSVQLGGVTSGILHVSFGSALTPATSGPGIIATNNVNFYVPYQPIELNFNGNNGGGDLTYIDVFTAPLKVQTYTGGTNGMLLQTKALANNTAQIVNQIGNVVSGNVTGPNFIYNTNNQLVRIVGPGDFNAPASFSQYPVFTEYLTHLQTNNIVTVVSNYNQFANASNTTNYRFTAIMDAKVTNNYQGYLTGRIETYTWTTNFSEGSNGPTFSNVTAAINATDPTNFTALAYAAGYPFPSNVVVDSPGWDAFYTYVGQQDIAGASNTFPQVPVADYYAAIVMGLAGSTVTNTLTGDTMAIKDYPTGHWWHNWTNIISFSDVQSNSLYYDAYADVFYRNSSNTAYGYAYSDRFDNNPVLFSLGSIPQGTNIIDYDTIVITIGQPTTLVPEATTALYVVLGVMGVAFVITSRPRIVSISRRVQMFLF